MKEVALACTNASHGDDQIAGFDRPAKGGDGCLSIIRHVQSCTNTSTEPLEKRKQQGAVAVADLVILK